VDIKTEKTRARVQAKARRQAAVQTDDPLRAAVEALSDTGFQLALPQTPRSGKPLRFKNWQWNDHLKAGPYGTREPESHKADITPQVVLVPMLAFCRDGRRLGYGGGYYDRSLAELRASDANVFACGIGFAAQEAAHIPTDGYDQMLDAMLTEREFYAFKY